MQLSLCSSCDRRKESFPPCWIQANGSASGMSRSPRRTIDLMGENCLHEAGPCIRTYADLGDLYQLHCIRIIDRQHRFYKVFQLRFLASLPPSLRSYLFHGANILRLKTRDLSTECENFYQSTDVRFKFMGYLPRSTIILRFGPSSISHFGIRR